jgi:uncharacterized repeat protein (TIGR01451 family)
MRRPVLGLVAALTLALLAVAPASAKDSVPDGGDVVSGSSTLTQPGVHHAGTSGHLPPKQQNVDLVSRLKLSNVIPEWVTDIATYRDTAYLGAWQTQCTGVGNPGIPGGFWTVDIKDPNNPRELGFTPSPVGSYLTEGLHAFRLTTPSFTGDVLLVSQERCDSNNAAHQGGFSLYDVTNPATPVPLVLSRGDQENTPGTSHSAHTAFGWDAGDKAYVAVMDNQEYGVDDIDIFDITDPRNPVMIHEMGLPDWPAAQDNISRGNSPGLHDLIVRRAEGKWLMLASYWDAGYVLLDVTNPAQPVYMRDTDFPVPDTLTGRPFSEGNAHEAEFDRCPEEGVRSRFPCGDVRYVVAADEDFTPFPLVARITSGPFNNQEFGGAISGNSKQIGPGESYAGNSYYVGLACTAGATPAAPSPTAIAIVQRGTCTFSEKYAAVRARGYAVMIVFNSTAAGNGCESLINMLISPSPTEIPAIFVSRSTGFRLLGITGYDPAQCRTSPTPAVPPVGTQGSNIDISSEFDGWGYMRLFDYDTFEELDAYAVPEALDPRYAEGFGDLSVHEVTTDPTGDVGYVAYYSAGLRVVDYSRGRLDEVGAYIAPEGSNYWGVELNVRKDGRLYVLASDRDYGLYIFRFGTDLQNRARIGSRGSVGQTMTLSAAVRNDGTIAETATRWTARLPRGLRAVGASPSQGSCRISGRTVTCNMGTLREDARARVLLRVRPTTAGTKRITTTVNGRKAEYDVGNNESRVTTRVRGAAGTAGVGLTGRP